MYENIYKNPADAKLNDLENFLQLIADLNIDIELFAIGGTAMVIKNIKESTKDIDFLTTTNYKILSKLLKLAGLREASKSKQPGIWYLNDKIRIDIFFDEFIMGITLPDDWKKLSEHIRDIGNLKLYVLNWYDIIITKIARSEARDVEDSVLIIKKMNLDFKILKTRYYDLAETSLISDYNTKFKHLEREMKKR